MSDAPVIKPQYRQEEPDSLVILAKIVGMVLIWCVVIWFLIEGLDLANDRSNRKDGVPFGLLTCQLIAFAVPIVTIYLERIRAHCKRQARAAEQTRDMLAEIYGYKKPTKP